MEIISLRFLIFTLIVLVAYYLLTPKAQNIWLLLASYVFYAFWNPWFTAVLALTTLLNFWIGKRIWQGDENKKSWLFFGLTIDLLSFTALKIIAADLFNLQLEASLAILIPIGFSFYILQAISYLLDVQNKRLTATSNLIDFALYMAYFPKMVSGPIERARVFLPLLAAPRTVDQKKLSAGFTLILIGLVRKLIFAQLLHAAIPVGTLTNIGQTTGLGLLCGILLYAFWLYNDFAGYTSLVRGISLLFGIELTSNFQQPYFSRNFTEFWNRWHISLSHWLRDYIFFPLSRWLARHNPKGSKLVNIVVPPLTTMLASGLWHSFSPAMLLWGALHAFFQIIERLLSLWHPRPPVEKQAGWRQLGSALLVFGLTLITWIPFASGSAVNTYRFLRMLIGKSFFEYPDAVSVRWDQLILPGIIILLTVTLDWVQYHSKDETIFTKLPAAIKGALLAISTAALALMLFLQTQPISAFIYQGF